MVEKIDIYLYTYCEINKGDHRSAAMAFYEAGTYSPKTVYSDLKGEVVALNPATANGEGRFPKLFIEKPYKVEIVDRKGLVVFTDEIE